ncbi:MAG TPA: hypothetical protein VEC36_08765, partial [Patescibacteria group bacterium]|nr:hypothetical protein [Patescibacteria group bacterium]
MMNGCAAKDSMNYIAGGNTSNTSFIFKTSDGGRLWTKIFVDSAKLDKSQNPPYVRYNILVYDMAYLSNGVMIVVADSTKEVKEGNISYQKETGVLLRSVDGGQTWTAKTFGSLSDINARRIRQISMSDSLHGIVSQSISDVFSQEVRPSPILQTTDGGLTWNETVSPDTGFVVRKIASPSAGVWIMLGWSHTYGGNVIWR